MRIAENDGQRAVSDDSQPSGPSVAAVEKDGAWPDPLGPLLGWPAWAKALRRGPRAAAIAVVVAVLLWTVPVAAVRTVDLYGRVADLEGSSVVLLPPIRIEGGVLWTPADVPRALQSDRWVVVLDPRPGEGKPEPASPGDRRPRYVLRDQALVIYTADRPVAQILPWAQVNAVWPRIDVDGASLISALRGAVPAMVLAVTAIGAVAAMLASLLLSSVVAAFLGALVQHDAYAPSRRGRLTIALTAALPAIAVASPFVAGRVPWVVTGAIWTIVAGVGAAAGVRRLRLRDEQGAQRA